MSLSSHQSTVGKSQAHLTPPEWIERLGPFDMDPCCPPNMPWETASVMLTEAEDGLKTPWSGFVWLNPPFNRYLIGNWLRKMVLHNHGIALVAARTETKWFKESIWKHASAICFVDHRPKFYSPEGIKAKSNSGAPIVLAGYGPEGARRLFDAGMGITLDPSASRGER